MAPSVSIERAEWSDRRGASRVVQKLVLLVELSPDQTRIAISENISSGGLMFALDMPVSLPAELIITLILPDGNHLVTHGEVRHVAKTSDGLHVGVQFRQLDAIAQGTIQRVLQVA